MFFGVRIQAINMTIVLDSDPRLFQKEPDTLSLAKAKVKSLFSEEIASLIEKVTQPVDDDVTNAIKIDPILRGLANKTKTA